MNCIVKDISVSVTKCLPGVELGSGVALRPVGHILLIATGLRQWSRPTDAQGHGLTPRAERLFNTGLKVNQLDRDTACHSSWHLHIL